MSRDINAPYNRLVSNAPTRLRAERLRRGWTLTRLTMMTGISTADLSQIEHGKRFPFRGWRERLAKAFGLPVDALFTEKS